ncbi:MAG: caspase family protein [Myxococcota bacterium]
MSAALISLLLLAAEPPPAPPAPAPVRRYAIIIGVNDPFTSAQKPLSYADDDAVRFYSLFRELPGEAALFTLLDEETQRLYPEAAPEAELPEKEAIFARADRMFQAIAADKARGVSTELYLIYSGHGLVDERGEGRLGLRGGTFSRTELYERFLARSPASVNHLIVDACDAYFFVQARGNDPDVDQMLSARAREFLDRQTLARFPTTGAILSTASMAESHEWSEIKGGVFSHQVRSAILGAADADGDGRISYDELEAFVLAANLGVKHAGASRAVFVRAPERDRQHPVLELSALARAHRLLVPPGLGGRIAIADDQGRRYLDLNKATGFGLVLALLPGLHYFVTREDADYLVPGEGKETDLSLLAAAAPTLRARGAGIADAYEKGLFAVPFGPQLVDGFRLGLRASSQAVLVPDESHPLRTASLVTGSLAAALSGVAIGFWAAGNGAAENYAEVVKTGTPRQQQAASAQVQDWDTRTNVAVGAAIGLGVTALGLLGLDLLEVKF